MAKHPRDRFDEVPDDLGRTVVTIGNFDGVHLGHQHVVRRAREVAADLGVDRVVAVTFDPHPIAVLRPEHAPPTLTTVPTRVALPTPLIQRHGSSLRKARACSASIWRIDSEPPRLSTAL